MDVPWRKLCLQTEGMLFSNANLQIGFKADFRGYAARLGIYLGNVSSQPFSGVAVELITPSATQPALLTTAAPVQDTLAPRAQALHMISMELLSPFAAPPTLAVTWHGSGGGGAVLLPVLPMRFLSPWPLGKDEYFRLWRVDGLSEAQSKFTFANAMDVAGVKALLSGSLRLAVLEGVDPSPTNVCAAAALATKSGVVPPAPGGHYCLLRHEIVPNHTNAADGSKRAASRLTVRATDMAIADGVMQSLTAQLGDVLKS
jgi:AP-2 complex subunit alpha